jgi:predicted enzyme related to lactoylglutathione lyase
MANNAVGWFEIYVQDMTRAKKFYEAMLHTKLEKLNSEKPELWSFPGNMTGYGAPGALVKMQGVPSGGNSTLVYFSCADCAVEAKRAVAAGGRIDKPKFAIGQYGFIALVFDTEGNLFGLHSMK